MSEFRPVEFRVPPDATIEDVDLDEVDVRLADGTRLTEARAEQMAAESLAAARSANLIPGRKSLSGDGSHSPVLQVRLPKELRDQIKARARTEGVSVSKLTRRLFEEYLAS